MSIGLRRRGVQAVRRAVAGITDTFNRANSTTLGSAETGQAWSYYGGVWGVSSNRAYQSTPAADSFAVVDLGKAAQDITVDYVVAVGGMCVVARIVDRGNNYLADGSGNGGTAPLAILRKSGGGYTVLGNGPNTSGASTIRFVASGTSLTMYQNGVQVIAVTDSAHQTATLVGIRSDADTAGRFDNFQAV